MHSNSPKSPSSTGTAHPVHPHTQAKPHAHAHVPTHSGCVMRQRRAHEGLRRDQIVTLDMAVPWPGRAGQLGGPTRWTSKMSSSCISCAGRIRRWVWCSWCCLLSHPMQLLPSPPSSHTATPSPCRPPNIDKHVPSPGSPQGLPGSLGLVHTLRPPPPPPGPPGHWLRYKS